MSSAIDYNKPLLFSEIRRAGHKRNQSKKKKVSAQCRTLGVRHKALTSFVCLFVFFTDLFSLVRQTSQKKRLLVVDVSYAKV